VDSTPAQIKASCNGLKIDFYDFNYMPNLFIKDNDFRDNSHMNAFGAAKVSKQLGLILISEMKKFDKKDKHLVK
jgi:hypothetical protein